MSSPSPKPALNSAPHDPATAARERLHEIDQRARAFARENPVTCVVGALALGFVIGKLASRL